MRSNTYNRLGNDVLQHRSMDGHRGVDQGVGSIVAVFNRRRTDGDGEQSNGNEALQWKDKGGSVLASQQLHGTLFVFCTSCS